jgi:chromosome segregation ATPase
MEFLGPLSFVLLALFGALLFVLASARLRRLEERVEELLRSFERWETEAQRSPGGLQRLEAVLAQERQNLEDEMRRERHASEQRLQKAHDELAQRVAEHLRTVEWSTPSEDGAAPPELAHTVELTRTMAELARELDTLKSAVIAARGAAEEARASADRSSSGSEALKGELERLAKAQERSADARATLTRLVTEHLEAQGFERVVLLGDLEPRHPEDTQRVRVEAARRDAAWKGHVSVRGGRVVDVTLQPSYSMFP